MKGKTPELKRGMRRVDADRTSIIVRWDFERGKWMHSAGIVLNAREASVLACLAYAPTDAEIAKAVGIAISTVEMCVRNLKARFRTNGCEMISRSKLIQIANDLFI